MEEEKAKLDLVKEHVQCYDDFPKPGLKFLDLFSVLKNASAFHALHELFINHVKKLDGVNVIAALESRGFLFGPALSLELGLPFVPIRKKGKLPGKVKQISFDLEYGSDVFEVQIGSILPNQKVLLIDDVLATGGSLAASCQLISDLGAQVVECLVVIEVMKLKGREKVPAPVYAFIQDSEH